MAVKVNDKEVTKEEFYRLILTRVKQYNYIKRLSKTEIGRRVLEQKGIKPIVKKGN